MYTCNSCNLEFPTAGDQRSHMKSEWHRYNLKRRVAQLPPIDEDLFNSKVASLTIDDGSQNGKELTKKELRRREREAIQEKKRQILETARRAMLERMSDDVSQETISPPNDAEVASSHENEPTPEQIEDMMVKQKQANRVDIPPTTCLFCHTKKNANFESLDQNILHMFSAHGLYVPERKYLVDLEGLLKYLGEKIGFGNVCLVCSYQGKDIEAVREHMLNKRHMKIPYESEDEKLEISEFYDFSTSYGDVSDSVVEDGATNEEDWEDVSGSEDEDESEFTGNHDAIYRDGLDLVLPNGAVLGHRSLAKYYRQNLPPERILSEGQGTVIAAETRHFMNVRDRAALSTQKREWSRSKKREDVNDRRSAKFINNQPHFRDPLLQ